MEISHNMAAFLLAQLMLSCDISSRNSLWLSEFDRQPYVKHVRRPETAAFRKLDEASSYWLLRCVSRCLSLLASFWEMSRRSTGCSRQKFRIRKRNGTRFRLLQIKPERKSNRNDIDIEFVKTETGMKRYQHFHANTNVWIAKVLAKFVPWTLLDDIPFQISLVGVHASYHHQELIELCQVYRKTEVIWS